MTNVVLFLVLLAAPLTAAWISHRSITYLTGGKR